ncbi:hypothetical protein BDF19DRAFT_442943 [Syncephalis fuscata]|nr:hypothetical protein BDF19DRAFT_442943 [Syncephalis fuscata]
MTETPPATRRAGRGRGGRTGRRGASKLATVESKVADADEQLEMPLPTTTPVAPPPVAIVADARRRSTGRQRVLATEGESPTSSVNSTPRRQSASRRRRTSRRFEQLTSSSEEPELDLPDDHEPPRPDEAPLPTATSFPHMLWRAIANSPRWIREQGRGSDSETDSDTEVLRKLYQRRRVSGPYWLRPDVHAPNRLTYAENERNRRRRRRRLDALQNGEEYPYMSGSEFDDTDDDSQMGDDGEDDAYGDDWGERPIETMDDYPPPDMTQFAHLPGVDQLPPDADIEDIVKLLPKPSVWRRFRKGFRAYVRKPGLKLLKWIALRLLFAIFAVYWIIKEAVMMLTRISWTVLHSYIWKPLVGLLGIVLTGPVWLISNLFGGIASAWWRIFGGKGPSSILIALLMIGGGLYWTGLDNASTLLNYLPQPSIPTFRLSDLQLPVPFRVGSNTGTPTYQPDPKLEADLLARLDKLERSVGELAQTASDLNRHINNGGNAYASPSAGGEGSSAEARAAAAAAVREIRHVHEEIDAIRLRLGTVEARSKNTNEDLEVVRNTILPKEAFINLQNKYSELLTGAEKLSEKLQHFEQDAGTAKQNIYSLERNLLSMRDQVVTLKRHSETATGATPAFDWKEVEKYLERYLPARFLMTGELRVDDALIRYLDDWLSERAPAISSSVAANAKVDWSQLLREHQSDLDRMMHTRIERALREAKAQGELVDRDAVLTELRRHDLNGDSGWQGIFGSGSGYLKDDQLQATVRRELDRYQADGLAIPDYALLTAGARVVPRLTSDTFTPGLGSDAGRIRRAAWWLLSYLKPPVTKPASVALLPWRQPGDCWPMAGRSGRITVHLAKSIIPEAITLEHVDRRIALDATTSPKLLLVYAVAYDVPVAVRKQAMEKATVTATTATDGQSSKKSEWLWDDKQGVWTKPLIRFNYQLNGPAAQSFPLSPDVVGTFPVRLIQLRILDNHGQPDFTCLYRFRVHGRASPTKALTSTTTTTSV